MHSFYRKGFSTHFRGLGYVLFSVKDLFTTVSLQLQWCSQGRVPGVPEPNSPSLCYGTCYNFKKTAILAVIENGKKINLKTYRILFEGLHMNTMRKIIRGPCAYKPGISVHLLVSIDRYQLRVIMV